MTNAHREYVVASDNGADDLPDEDPKVMVDGKVVDAADYIATLKTPRKLPTIHYGDE